MNTAKQTVFMCAGEASGDRLGSELAKQLLADHPTLSIEGMGGQQMQAAGVKLLIDAESISVIGLFEALKHLRTLAKTKQRILQHLKQQPPQLLILIDFSGFNLRLAKAAKRLGIKIMYYVSPQVWAWRAWRIKTIKRYVDHIAVLYAFEQALYQRHAVPVSFVGHPIVKQAKANLSKAEVYRQFGLDSSKPIVGLFAGSRKQEIQKLLPILIESSERIKQKAAQVQFVLPLASNLDAKSIAQVVPNNIHIIVNHNYDLLQVMDAAIAVSGTITLEISLFQVPLVIFYKASRMSYWLAKSLAKIAHIGLCNIIAERVVATEYLQEQATASNLADEILKLLSDKAYHAQRVQQLAQVRRNLEADDQGMRAADVAQQLLQPCEKNTTL